MSNSVASAARGAPAGRHRHRHRRGGWAGFVRRYGAILPMAPGMLFLVVMSIYPTVYSLVISLFRWNLSDPNRMRFGGWHNYGLLLTDVTFWNAVFVTFKFVTIAVSVELVLGLAIALLFFQRFPGDRFLRALLILPMVVAPVVVGLLSRYMLNVQFGVVTFLTEILGLGRLRRREMRCPDCAGVRGFFCRHIAKQRRIVSVDCAGACLRGFGHQAVQVAANVPPGCCHRQAGTTGGGGRRFGAPRAPSGRYCRGSR